MLKLSVIALAVADDGGIYAKLRTVSGWRPTTLCIELGGIVIIA